MSYLSIHRKIIKKEEHSLCQFILKSKNTCRNSGKWSSWILYSTSIIEGIMEACVGIRLPVGRNGKGGANGER